MEVNERILSIVKEKGPILPVQVSREINDSILMTSARLSELLAKKQIKISSLKVGGSPLYYFQGQESKLQNFTDNLNGMEKKAYDLLSQDKVLRDSSQEPAIRVALREIKDFTIPLQVNYENKTEIFWKWYLTDSKEAESLIRNLLSKKETQQEKVLDAQKEEIKKDAQTMPKTEEVIPKETTKKPIEPQKETEKDLGQSKTNKELSGEQNSAKQVSRESENFQKEINKGHEPIESKKDTTKIKKNIDKTIFLKQVNSFFSRNKINQIETKEIKKDSEVDFIIELQTAIGHVRYFCKAKNKKKINESDLSTALLNAQSKSLPLLFLTSGKISKKTKEQLNTDFKNIVYREI